MLMALVAGTPYAAFAMPSQLWRLRATGFEVGSIIALLTAPVATGLALLVVGAATELHDSAAPTGVAAIILVLFDRVATLVVLAVSLVPAAGASRRYDHFGGIRASVTRRTFALAAASGTAWTLLLVVAAS